MGLEDFVFSRDFQGGKREDQSSPTEVKSGGWTVN